MMVKFAGRLTELEAGALAAAVGRGRSWRRWWTGRPPEMAVDVPDDVGRACARVVAETIARMVPELASAPETPWTGGDR